MNTSKYTSLEANFLFAAMHLACMKEFGFKDTCPDLPDNLDGLVRA